jgi:tetratricopeptide (TPR) repeat protein
LTSLGYLYRLASYHELAEKNYLRAIKKNKNNLTAWGNLSHLYRHMGHDKQAIAIVNRLTRKRSDNPFFHINMGDKDFEKKQCEIALGHYRTALKLNQSYHEVFLV